MEKEGYNLFKPTDTCSNNLKRKLQHSLQSAAYDNLERDKKTAHKNVRKCTTKRKMHDSFIFTDVTTMHNKYKKNGKNTAQCYVDVICTLLVNLLELS